MSDAIITIEGLSKRYFIGHLPNRGDGLRHRIESVVRHPFNWLRDRRRRASSAREEFWALQNVSLEVKSGDVVGIIGRNGAGKTTLLKVLSRITEPTRGRIILKGRIASLLEVGTGFHPELTGRENIFLNGAILGMTRREIRKKFDEIVDFSEIEKFLDTPVKRYSSGMYVRLAFAVAAHLEPEILVVDEVLAVGDAAFQKKCLGKMESVARHGRTVLFVSHNLGVVSKLCSRCVLLENGRKAADGSCSAVIRRYMESTFEADGQRRWAENAPHSSNVELKSIRIVSGGAVRGDVSLDEAVDIQIEFRTLGANVALSTSIHLLDSTGGDVLASINLPSACVREDRFGVEPLPQGIFRTTCTIPGNFLNEGSYGVTVVFINRAKQVELLEREAIRFRTHDSGAMSGEWTDGWLGVVRPRLTWRTELLQHEDSQPNSASGLVVPRSTGAAA